MESTIWLIITTYLILHGALLWGAQTQTDYETKISNIDDEDICTGTGIGSSSSLLDDDTDFAESSSSILDSSSCFSDSSFSINPVNGLPMMGCLDIEGNPYGTDLHSSWDDGPCMTSSFDDSFASTFCNDSFSSSFGSSAFDD